jgi:8-oxo-dGTP pyrophosphatase MutT (NUDIX family)
LRICAIREAYEETGIILGRYENGELFHGDDWAASVRGEVDRGELPFMDVVRRLGLRLDLSILTVFARWITPDMMPKRFDTWFYVATATDEQLASCDGRETVDAEWIPPLEALRLAQSGERTIIFPTRMNLQLLGEASSAADATARAAGRTLVTVLPVVEQREGGGVLVIPPEAGYGAVVEPLSAVR